MTLLDEIRSYFAHLNSNSAFRLSSLPEKYPGYVIRTNTEFGVALEISEDVLVVEKFNKCRFYTALLEINDAERRNYLILSSCFEEGRYEFASVCAEFLEPGKDGCNRLGILNSPHDWWKKWKELLGNRNSEQSVYSIIAELSVLICKFRVDHSVKWTSSISGSHDIECAEESCEVKSTIKRYDSLITITGQHQLKHEKTLWLYFCRMEESLEGTSIDELVDELGKLGYGRERLENEVRKAGFEKGTSARSKKYKILEKRKYLVDSSFPQITDNSFKGDKLPNNIIRIEYVVNLDGIDYESW